MENKMYTNATV